VQAVPLERTLPIPPDYNGIITSHPQAAWDERPKKWSDWNVSGMFDATIFATASNELRCGGMKEPMCGRHRYAVGIEPSGWCSTTRLLLESMLSKRRTVSHPGTQ
jgi:hypothetical protein